MKKVACLSLLALFLIGAEPVRRPLPEVPADLKAELVGHLKANWQSPEDYIVSKFKNHDIVFVGEYHRIEHDVDLIQNLIPLLYKAGVHNLGIEFGCYEYQDTVDYLLTAPTYDEALARWLMFKWMSNWGYVEYEDLYRAAWEFNRSLPPGAPKFRVVNLNYRLRWDLDKEDTREERLRVFSKGDVDEHMARVILDEFVHKGQKALVYSGNHHAFTRYRQPIYDEKTGKFYRFADPRIGNIVRDSMPDRVFCIMLHRPWALKTDENTEIYPIGGVIDVVMREFKDKRVGFDVVGSPFGKLSDTTSYYSAFHEGFKLSDYCDGYVFPRPFSEYEGCRVDTLFVTDANFQEAVDFLGNPQARKYFSNPKVFIDSMREDADFRRRFAHLQ